MQEPLQIKTPNKKLYPSPSATNFPNRFKTIPELHTNNKFPKNQKTVCTDDNKNSQISRNRIQQYYGQLNGNNSDDITGIYPNQSRTSKTTKISNQNQCKVLAQKQQKIIQLKQRLKNIHHFYRIRIEQQRSKNIQRNQIFIGIIQQLQKNHNDKILTYHKTLEQIEQQKQQIAVADERMSTIKIHIQQILKQSQEFKINNDKLQKQILIKEIALKDKQEILLMKKQQLDAMKDKLEQFQRLKLKEKKRKKEMLEMIEHVF